MSMISKEKNINSNYKNYQRLLKWFVNNLKIIRIYMNSKRGSHLKIKINSTKDRNSYKSNFNEKRQKQRV